MIKTIALLILLILLGTSMPSYAGLINWDSDSLQAVEAQLKDWEQKIVNLNEEAVQLHLQSLDSADGVKLWFEARKKTQQAEKLVKDLEAAQQALKEAKRAYKRYYLFSFENISDFLGFIGSALWDRWEKLVTFYQIPYKDLYGGNWQSVESFNLSWKLKGQELKDRLQRNKTQITQLTAQLKQVRGSERDEIMGKLDGLQAELEALNKEVEAWKARGDSIRDLYFSQKGDMPMQVMVADYALRHLEPVLESYKTFLKEQLYEAIKSGITGGEWELKKAGLSFLYKLVKEQLTILYGETLAKPPLTLKISDAMIKDCSDIATAPDEKSYAEQKLAAVGASENEIAVATKALEETGVAPEKLQEKLQEKGLAYIDKVVKKEILLQSLDAEVMDKLKAELKNLSYQELPTSKAALEQLSQSRTKQIIERQLGAEKFKSRANLKLYQQSKDIVANAIAAGTEVYSVAKVVNLVKSYKPNIEKRCELIRALYRELRSNKLVGLEFTTEDTLVSDEDNFANIMYFSPEQYKHYASLLKQFKEAPPQVQAEIVKAASAAAVSSRGKQTSAITETLISRLEQENLQEQWSKAADSNAFARDNLMRALKLLREDRDAVLKGQLLKSDFAAEADRIYNAVGNFSGALTRSEMDANRKFSERLIAEIHATCNRNGYEYTQGSFGDTLGYLDSNIKWIDNWLEFTKTASNVADKRSRYQSTLSDLRRIASQRDENNLKNRALVESRGKDFQALAEQYRQLKASSMAEFTASAQALLQGLEQRQQEERSRRNTLTSQTEASEALLNRILPQVSAVETPETPLNDSEALELKLKSVQTELNRTKKILSEWGAELEALEQSWAEYFAGPYAGVASQLSRLSVYRSLLSFVKDDAGKFLSAQELPKSLPGYEKFRNLRSRKLSLEEQLNQAQAVLLRLQQAQPVLQRCTAALTRIRTIASSANQELEKMKRELNTGNRSDDDNAALAGKALAYYNARKAEILEISSSVQTSLSMQIGELFDTPPVCWQSIVSRQAETELRVDWEKELTELQDTYRDAADLRYFLATHKDYADFEALAAEIKHIPWTDPESVFALTIQPYTERVKVMKMELLSVDGRSFYQDLWQRYLSVHQAVRDKQREYLAMEKARNLYLQQLEQERRRQEAEAKLTDEERRIRQDGTGPGMDAVILNQYRLKESDDEIILRPEETSGGSLTLIINARASGAALTSVEINSEAGSGQAHLKPGWDAGSEHSVWEYPVTLTESRDYHFKIKVMDAKGRQITYTCQPVLYLTESFADNFTRLKEQVMEAYRNRRMNAVMKVLDEDAQTSNLEEALSREFEASQSVETVWNVSPQQKVGTDRIVVPVDWRKSWILKDGSMAEAHGRMSLVFSLAGDKILRVLEDNFFLAEPPVSAIGGTGSGPATAGTPASPATVKNEVELLSPPNGTFFDDTIYHGHGTVNFSWKAFSGADRYQVIVEYNGEEKIIKTNVNSLAEWTALFDDILRKAGAAHTPRMKFTWRVQAYHGSELLTDKPAWSIFYTAP